MAGDVRASLDRQHQIEGDQVERVTISSEIIGGGGAPSLNPSEMIGQLGKFAGDEIAIDHQASRDASRASQASRIRANHGPSVSS